MSDIEVHGPNWVAWEWFRAIMESLAESMDDSPMVTNDAGVDFLEALAKRGYRVVKDEELDSTRAEAVSVQTMLRSAEQDIRQALDYLSVIVASLPAKQPRRPQNLADLRMPGMGELFDPSDA